MTNKQKFLFFGVLLLAIFFRYYLITQMPGGLFPDEAANGLDVNLMQQGHLQPFYERGNGREALFFYMEWASVSLLGKGAWQMHAVSAFVGTMAVLACFFLTRKLFSMGEEADEEKRRQKKNRATNIALLAMFLMAVGSWHVVLSRTAFRANTIPLFTTLTLIFLIGAWEAKTIRNKIFQSILCGIAFALGFYTYIAFRIMAPIVFMLVFWPLLGQIRYWKFWQTVHSYKVSIISFIFAFVVVIAPIFHYFYTHPGSFIGRSGQVSVFNQTLYTVNGQELTSTPPLFVVLSVIGEVTKTELLGFFTHGDLNWRHNVSNYPFLSPLVSPFFAVGLVSSTILGIWYFFAPNKRKDWWKYFLLTGWFWGMLVPVITTAEGIPHGLRTIGVIPAVYILSAWALYNFGALIYKYHKRIWEKCWCHPKTAWDAAYSKTEAHEDAHPHSTRFRFVTGALKFVVVCFCAALILQTFSWYFVYAYNDASNFYYFRSDLTPVAQYLLTRCNQSLADEHGSTKDSTFLVLDKFSVQTTDFTTSDWKGNFNAPCNVPYQQVDPENAWELPKLQPGQEVVFTQSSMFDTKKFKEHHPEASLHVDITNKFGQHVVAVYVVR